jgi:hypothetical protein
MPKKRNSRFSLPRLATYGRELASHERGRHSPVAQLLGHKYLRMAARYQHLSPGFLADAVGGLDTAFAECHQYVTIAKELPEAVTVSA